MTTTRRPCLAPPLVIGMVMLVLGVLFLLNNLGIFPADRALRYLPAALILFGVLKLLQARRRGAVAGWIWILIGTWWLLENLGVVTIDFGTALLTYWPAILVLIGASMLWRAIRRGGAALVRQPRKDPGPRP
jgi:hypothetical protein